MSAFGGIADTAAAIEKLTFLNGEFGGESGRASDIFSRPSRMSASGRKRTLGLSLNRRFSMSASGKKADVQSSRGI